MSQITEQEYFCIITDAGAALEAEAHANGLPVRLTHIAVGDGDGEVPTPSRTATGLAHEVYRRAIDASRIDGDDPNICWISAVIPADVGGFWIREFGIFAEPFTEDGEPVLYGYGNHAPYYKVDRILGQASTHELEIPVIMSGTASVQIMVRDSGYAAQSALNLTNQELGALRINVNSHSEDITSLKAFDEVVAEAIQAATYEKLGPVKPDGLTLAVDENGKISVNIGAIYELLEFYYFRHPDLKPGFEALDGGVIENGAEMYPEAWAKLQTEWGQQLCLSATDRETLRSKVYYTLADGTQIGYGGIGGVPYFTINTATGAITMPDIRGMHLEAAGFDSLNVGGVAIDSIRESTGELDISAAGGHGYNLPYRIENEGISYNSSGIFCTSYNGSVAQINASSMTATTGPVPRYSFSRTTPVSVSGRPRSLAVLACAYMGQPTL